jgi:hypothetical protein
LELFAALHVATGEVIAKTEKRHRAQDFVSFLRELDRSVDETLEVHLILPGSEGGDDGHGRIGPQRPGLSCRTARHSGPARP